MYWQIIVHPDDRRYQQILWSSVGEPAEFQLNTVTYDLICGPYLALCGLRQLVCDEESQYPEVADIVLNEMYVDDSQAPIRSRKPSPKLGNSIGCSWRADSGYINGPLMNPMFSQI